MEPVTPGMQLNRMLDQLGLPDVFGDMMGAMLDAKVGNQYGVMRDLLDAYSGLATSTFDQLSRQSIPPFGFTPRPHDKWSKLSPAIPPELFPAKPPKLNELYPEERYYGYYHHTYYERKNIWGSVNADEIKKFLNDYQIKKFLKDHQIFGWTPSADKLAKEIAEDPVKIAWLMKNNDHFKAYMEAKLGGQIIWDPEKLDWADRGIGVVVKTVGEIPTYLKLREDEAISFMERINHEFANALSSTLLPLIGLPYDPNQSIADKLALLLKKFAEKKMKELEDKIQEMQKGGGGGGIPTIGGGILGGMFGGPLGAMAGQALGGVAENILGGAQGGGGAQGAGGGQESETLLQAEIQLLQQKLQRFMELLSNLMKSFDDAMSTSIRNIR